MKTIIYLSFFISLLLGSFSLNGEEPAIKMVNFPSNVVAACQKNLVGQIDEISSDEKRIIILFTGVFYLTIDGQQSGEAGVKKGYSVTLKVPVKDIMVVVKTWTEEDRRLWPFAEADWRDTVEKLKKSSELGSTVSLAINPVKPCYSVLGQLIIIEGNLIGVID